MVVNIDGINTYYDVEGNGTPVILIHGWGASSKTMDSIKKHLSKTMRVYNLDLIGFGNTDLPREPLNTDDFGNFLKRFIEILEIENPILIGHSNGGRTIINLVGRNLIPIEKVVLIDSAGIKPIRSFKYYLKVYTYKILKKISSGKLFKNTTEKLIKKFGSQDYKNSPEILRKTMSIIINEDQKENLKNINIPTLIVWGENDTATPVSDAKIMKELVMDSKLVILKDAGHYSYLDKINEFKLVLDEFLKEDKEIYDTGN